MFQILYAIYDQLYAILAAQASIFSWLLHCVALSSPKNKSCYVSSKYFVSHEAEVCNALDVFSPKMELI